MDNPAEIQRIAQSAARFKAYRDRVTPIQAELGKPAVEASEAAYQAVMNNQPVWVEIEGVKALQVPGQSLIAVPCNGRKNCRRFDVIDLNDRTDTICQLTKVEVRGWLVKRALA